MYRKGLFVIVFLCLLTGTVFAQDNSGGIWQPGSSGKIEYNCDTVASTQAAIKSGKAADIANVSELPFARDQNGQTFTTDAFISSSVMILLSLNADTTITSDDIFKSAITACANVDSSSASNGTGATFNVVASGTANLRSCAGTNCSIVGKTTNGQILTVISTEGDWYEVQLDNGTAYISSSVTTPGPDAVIQTDQTYTDPKTGCMVAFDIKRGSSDISLILAGKHQDKIVADLYRPRENNPLRVEGQLDKTFTDTGDPYILQYYSFDVSWPKGVYQLTISINGQSSRLAWTLDTSGIYNIYIYCDN